VHASYHIFNYNLFYSLIIVYVILNYLSSCTYISFCIFSLQLFRNKLLFILFYIYSYISYDICTQYIKIIFLWNLSQQLNYPLNYLLQITPPGTSKLLYCWLQIMYSAMFLAPFHVLQQQLELVMQLLKIILLFLPGSVRIIMCFWLCLVLVVLRHRLWCPLLPPLLI